MISHLAMNVTLDLNIFPSKEIITNITRLKFLPMHMHHKLTIQIIQIVREHLMEFIYALLLIF